MCSRLRVGTEVILFVSCFLIICPSLIFSGLIVGGGGQTQRGVTNFVRKTEVKKLILAIPVTNLHETMYGICEERLGNKPEEIKKQEHRQGPEYLGSRGRPKLVR